MSKRSDNSSKTPEKKRKKSGDAGPDIIEAQTAQVIVDFVDVYCVAKDDTEVMHVALKAVVQTLFGFELGGRDGRISKAIGAKFPRMLYAKNQAEATDTKLYALRIRLNTDM
ncbi:hypothetical protein DIPPA_14839, partial [Diplonema papillatum]